MFKWMLSAICVLALVLPLHAQALPGTKLLKGKEDFAKVMVEGIGKWLDRETAESEKKRQAHWKPDYSSLKAYGKSVNSNRERFKKIIGLVDQRLPPAMEYVGGPTQPSLAAKTDTYKIHAVRWPVLPGVNGEGLLLEPTGKVKANVVALPDADLTPEILLGLRRGLQTELD